MQNIKDSSLVLVNELPQEGEIYSGQSVSFQLLLEGLSECNISFNVVNLSRNHTSLKIPLSSFNVMRIVDYLYILTDYFFKTAFSNKTVYIAIARSKAGFFRDFIMIWWAWFKKHKIICHVHGGNYDEFYEKQPLVLQLLIKKTLLKVDTILILGERLRTMYDFEPRLKEKLYVVSNGLPIKDYDPPEPKCLPTESDRPIQLLYLSNLIESKGYLDVLESVRILVQEYGIYVQCTFCGEFLASPDDVIVKNVQHGRLLFEKFIKKHSLEKYVIYKKVIFGKEKIEVLKKSHFFLLPTNYNTEGQPISIIEAIAYGNIVISTNYRAIPDLVLHRKTGYLVSYNQPKEIAIAIHELTDDPQKYKEMSLSAIQHFIKNFTREAHLEQILRFLLN